MAHDESFFREVSEDLRTARLKEIWSRFGIYIIALVVVLILGTIGKVGYDYWSAGQAAQSGDAYLAALKLADANKTDEALAALEEIEKNGHGDYPTLARMRSAAIVANKGDFKAAIDAYSKIGADESEPLAIRDAARVRAAYLLVDHGTYEEVAAQVESLSDADNPFRHSAREALGLAAWKAGDIETAKKWFDLISGDQTTPAGIARHARLMLDLIAAGDKPA
jgi:hypothetical protein